MAPSVDCAVVIAVGASAHQSQLAYNRPRAMLPALGKPLVVRVMERLYHAGIRRYSVILGEDEGAVAAYLSDHWLPNVTIEFVIQAAADSLNHILQRIAASSPPPFAATSYNSFTHPHFAERLLNQGIAHSSGLVLCSGETPLLRPNELDRQITGTDRQPAITSDLALCGQKFIEYLEQAKPRRELRHLFLDYMREENPTHIVSAGWTLQVHTDEDLHNLNWHLLEEEQDASILSEIPNNVQIIPPVRIDPQVSVGSEARIGPHVYLETGCSVGHHAVVRNTLVLQRAIIPPHAIIEDSVISSRSHTFI